jgi:hypothetical protein
VLTFLGRKDREVMSTSVFTEINQHPTEDLIFSHLGKNKVLWITLFEYIHEQHPDIVEEWRYYQDGKSWLLKVTRKAKTVFWLSVIERSFRITFYFTDRAQPFIEKSTLSPALKEQFKTGKKYGKIRGVTVLFKTKKDCTDAQELIRIKLSVK